MIHNRQSACGKKRIGRCNLRCDFIGAQAVHESCHLLCGLHTFCIYFTKEIDIAKNLAELAGIAFHLAILQIQACEFGNVPDVIRSKRRHKS